MSAAVRAAPFVLNVLFICARAALTPRSAASAFVLEGTIVAALLTVVTVPLVVEVVAAIEFVAESTVTVVAWLTVPLVTVRLVWVPLSVTVDRSRTASKPVPFATNGTVMMSKQIGRAHV